MQGDNGPAAFVGLQEEAVVGVVVEEILGEGADGLLFDAIVEGEGLKEYVRGYRDKRLKKM